MRALHFYLDSFRGLGRPMWLLAFVTLVNRAGTMVVPFLTLYFSIDQGLGPTRAGWLLGSFGLGSMSGSWIGGQLADRFDPNRVQALSLMATGVAFGVLSQLHGFWPLALGVFLTATISDIFRPALFTAVVHYCPPELRARGFALIRLAVNVGMSLGPGLGGFLAVRSYSLLFWVDGATCIAAGLLLMVLLGPAPKESFESEVEEEAAAAAGGPFQDRFYLAFLGLIILLAVCFFQLLSTWPLDLRLRYGLPEDGIGSLLAVNALLVAAIEMPLLKLVENRRPLRVAAWGCLLVTGGLAMIALGPPLAWAWGAMLVWSLGEMLALPLTNAAVARMARPGRVGAYMGAYSLAFSVALVLAPIVGTALYAGPGPAVLWWGMVGVGVLLFFGFRRVASKLDQVEDPSGST